MTTRARLSALLLAFSLALVGCGGSDTSEGSGDIADLSPDQVIAAAEQQLAAEEFVSIKGKGTDRDEGTELEIDLGFVGDTASGTITTNGMELELLKADGQTYFKAGEEFFTSGGSDAETMDLVGGRWVLVDAANPTFGELVSFVSKKDFFEQLLDPDGKVTKVDDKTVNGVECIGLKSTDSTLYFDAEDGKPISLVTTEDGSGTLDFTYDEIAEAEAPPAAEVVDLSKVS